MPVTACCSASLSLAIPLIFGALGGVIGERVGVVNIAIEGQLLAGAFSAAVLASITGSPFARPDRARWSRGVLVAFVLAAFAIKYLVDQVIVGVVLNVLVTGLTGFLYSQVLLPNAALLNTPAAVHAAADPGARARSRSSDRCCSARRSSCTSCTSRSRWSSSGLFRTRWGLRLRAVGEHPQAADTVGIKVNATRFWNVAARRRDRRHRRQRTSRSARHRRSTRR